MYLNKYISLKTPEGNINIDLGTAITIFSHKIKQKKYNYLFNQLVSKSSPKRDKYKAPPPQSKIVSEQTPINKIKLRHVAKIRTKKTVSKASL